MTKDFTIQCSIPKEELYINVDNWPKNLFDLPGTITVGPDGSFDKTIDQAITEIIESGIVR